MIFHSYYIELKYNMNICSVNFMVRKRVFQFKMDRKKYIPMLYCGNTLKKLNLLDGAIITNKTTYRKGTCLQIETDRYLKIRNIYVL